MSEDVGAVVMDNGSGLCKAGFGGENAPRVVIPSIIGTSLYPPSLFGIDVKDDYVGAEAQERRGILSLRYPIEHGIVNNWDDMEKIWDHTFHQLNVKTEDKNIMLTEAPRNPSKNREKMMEAMFEKYNVPGSYVAVQAVLSLYTTRTTDGLVLDCGDGISHVVPVCKGRAIPKSVVRLEFGGRDLNGHLSTMLMERGIRLTTSAEMEIVREMKEQLCYVAEDYNKEMEKNEAEIEKTYTLPDGQTVNIGNQRFRCPELLFQPSLMGEECMGIQDAVHAAIKKCSVDNRKDLYGNIVLAGGTTMFPGMVERLYDQLKRKNKNSNSINITAVDNRRFSAWIGGSILSSIDCFQSQWITKDMYKEEGAGIVHKKCL